MAYTTINKYTDYFNTKLYTGNGSTNAITGVGFQPDWVWIKSRTHTHNHFLHDAVRGVTKSIFSNLASAEDTNAQYLTAFGTDGFTVGTNGSITVYADQDSDVSTLVFKLQNKLDASTGIQTINFDFPNDDKQLFNSPHPSFEMPCT